MFGFRNSSPHPRALPQINIDLVLAMHAPVRNFFCGGRANGYYRQAETQL
jgi:hypothetical protein